MKIAALKILTLLILAQSSWVDKLTNQRTHLCCSNADGRRLDDPEWRFKANGYQVLFTEGWIDIPDWALVREPNLDGFARVWSVVSPTDGRVIWCFLPGAAG